MKTVTTDEAQRQFQQLLRQAAAGKTRMLIEEDGKPLAVLISAADYAQLQRDEAERERDFAVFEEISAAFKDEPLEKIEQEVAQAVREVRARRGKKQPTSSP